MPDKDDPSSNIYECVPLFNEAFGRTMISWANIEQRLFFWFVDLTGMDIGVARSVYYTFTGFGRRAKMLLKVVRAIDMPDDRRSFLEAALKKAENFNQFRNRIAHGEGIIDASSDVDTRLRMMVVDGRQEFPDNLDKAVTLDLLEVANDYFFELTKILSSSRLLRGLHDGIDFEELRQRVIDLPNSDKWHKLAQITPEL